MSLYKCAVCKKYFNNETSEEERKLKCLEDFGPLLATMDEQVQVCSECYEKIKPNLHPSLLERAKTEVLKKKKK